MRARVAEKLADQVREWSHRGLVDDELGELLARRYDTEGSLREVFLRWLGFFALFLLASSVLSVLSSLLFFLPGAVVRYVAPFALPAAWGAVAFGLWWKGGQMATDPAQRFPVSGHVLVTLGLLVGYGALNLGVSYAGFLAQAAVVENPWGFAGWVARLTQWPLVAAALYTAYRLGLRWPLGLGLLLGFAALGNTAGMWGLGSYYFFSAVAERTLVAGAVVAALGVWHEEKVEEGGGRFVGFGQVYVVTGLLFANVAAWQYSLFHTIPRAWDAPAMESTLLPVLLVMALRVMQVVLGSRLHDGRFVGFGIVFLAIDLYTRFFEHFWDEASKAALFVAAGLAAMLVGALLERRARSLGLRSA